MSQDDDLTKIVVDLPHHGSTGGESIWAHALGDDLFEVHNVPFYSYGLNFLDIARAVEPSPGKKPLVLELVESSGHQTLRVSFTDALPDSERTDLLRQLGDYRAYFEGANSRYFAIDVEPHGDYAAVRARLEEWEEAGLLEYETYEPRAPGSFDGRPDEGVGP